tara:strand:+ start:3676 stop:3975 length:300 start_codon:yes stop_codon:yes gene_type:complete
MNTQALGVGFSPDFKVSVQTTENRGFTPEEVAERCADKIINISDQANPIIREQAHTFRKYLVQTLTLYMREAIKSDRTTVYNALKEAGQPELANLIRRL